MLATSDDLEDDPLVSGVFAMIDYVAASLAHTRRHVTMERIEGHGGDLRVRCRCHLRDATRTFRLDRIACFITGDGEVMEPRDFWPTIGLAADRVPPFMAPGSAREIADAPQMARIDLDDGPESMRLALRRLMRHQIRVLAALSRSDGSMPPSEVEAIVQYAVIEGEMKGLLLDDAEITELGGYITRLRPAADKVDESAKALFAPGALTERELMRFWRAAKAVVDADGRLLPEEFEFLCELQDMIERQGS